MLYIGGYSRSGSTLLEQLLGQIKGFFSVGEVRHIWDRSFTANQLCGCGKAFKKCIFWKEVVKEAFGGFERLDIEEIKSLKHSTDRIRYVPFLMVSNRLSSYAARFDAYSQILSQLYRAIQKVSDCEIIIDSSKDPSHGFLLNAMPEIDFSTIHLVRDSRAVTFSWQRKKHKPEIHWKHENMQIHTSTRTALEWDLMNFATHVLSHVTDRYVLLHYEDFVNSPQSLLRECLTRLGLGGANLDFLESQRVQLKAKHTVSGNPIRFHNGSVLIRPDVEWREKMLKFQKYFVTAATFPLLFRYGYIAKKRPRLGR
ncbi:MAG: sulfotransferase [Thermodesulfobacteriota bacterium]